MRSIAFEAIANLVADHGNGWSMGSFGALGEFMRKQDEPAEQCFGQHCIQVATHFGALRIERENFQTVAWDSLSADGHGWNHNLALCVADALPPPEGIRSLGGDLVAVRSADRPSQLFDLGVTPGLVRMCVRTSDPELQRLLKDAEGCDVLVRPDLLAAIFRAQPHRVMLSPAGRIEVFAPIPPPHGASPQGPHTHLLPRLIATRRLHSANDPIPDGLQSVLTMHPRRPWQGDRASRIFDADADRAFFMILDAFSLAEDVQVRDDVVAAAAGLTSELSWPADRRGRAKARITLRRLAAAGNQRARAWQAQYDGKAGSGCGGDLAACD